MTGLFSNTIARPIAPVNKIVVMVAGGAENLGILPFLGRKFAILAKIHHILPKISKNRLKYAKIIQN